MASFTGISPLRQWLGFQEQTAQVGCFVVVNVSTVNFVILSGVTFYFYLGSDTEGKSCYFTLLKSDILSACLKVSRYKTKQTFFSKLLSYTAMSANIMSLSRWPFLDMYYIPSVSVRIHSHKPAGLKWKPVECWMKVLLHVHVFCSLFTNYLQCFVFVFFGNPIHFSF